MRGLQSNQRRRDSALTSVGFLVGDSVGFFVGDSVGFFVGDCGREMRCANVVSEMGESSHHINIEQDSALTSVGFFVGDSVGFFVGDSVGFFVGDCGREMRCAHDVS